MMIRYIAVGVAIAAMSVALGAIFFYRAHHHSKYVSAQTAEAEFQVLRDRFSGQTPLLDMKERRPSIDRSSQARAAPIHAYHAMIFDRRGGQRLIQITVPYSFGRFFGRGGFRWLGQLTFLDDTEFDPEPIQLSLDQIARNGPGLLVDYRHASGGQFVAWVD
jgi:hypothetical protein